MAHIVRIESVGGPEVLRYESVEMPRPGADEVLIENRAIGVNFVDIYHRSGLYGIPLPATLGVEGAGVVLETGAAVSGLKPGDRVVYAGAPLGAYASHRLLPARRAIALPDDVSFEVAAAIFLKGLTADMLLSKVFAVGSGITMLVHGAAGGTGVIVCAWAKTLGARVIGAVSSEAKAEIARAAGADEVIVGRDADFGAEIMKLTGSGVDVVYDGIGGTTLSKSLQCVRLFGTVVSIGQVAGKIPPIDIDEIGRRAASLSRPSIIAYIGHQPSYEAASQRVFAALAKGVMPVIGETFALSQVEAAHRALAAGATTGSTILVP